MRKWGKQTLEAPFREISPYSGRTSLVHAPSSNLEVLLSNLGLSLIRRRVDYQESWMVMFFQNLLESPRLGDNMDGKGLRHVAYSIQFVENYPRFKERQHRT